MSPSTPSHGTNVPSAGHSELERRNLVFAWSLFALVLLIAAGAVAVAFIYLAAD
jgi:hypothetical protein